MLGFLVKKVARSAAVLIVVTFATFLLIYGNGPGIARNVLGGSISLATQAQVHEEMVKLGLDRPLVVQYGTWFQGALTGNLQASFFTGQPVTSTLLNRVPVTLSLAGLTLLLTIVFSVMMGVAAAVYGGWIDRLVQLLAVLGGAVPSFIVAIGLVFALAVDVRLFPATGYVSPGQSVSQWAQSLVLPVIALLVGSVGSAASQFRGAVKDTLEQDYVRTLRARGILERQVILRHVLRNAAGPGLTVLSLQTIALIGGVVVIEQVFALPGMGQLATSAAEQGDVPVVMGCVLVIILLVLVVNVLTDVASALLNPKAKLQ
jgi:peptide/nickel transport system permease protein